MKETQEQLKLPGVPKAKQGREVPPHWEWTEAVVWTERMLATLERGIKGGKWSEMAKCLFRGTWVNLHGLNPRESGPRSHMKPTDRRAVCGKSARTVRREGRGSNPRSYPYLAGKDASRH